MQSLFLFFYDTMISMEKTEELYYKSAYIKEFDARVIECTALEDGKFEVVLDRTAFFPEQGGQGSDFGVLTDIAGNECKVTHVSIDDDIRHITDHGFKVGDEVHGIIDWNHRFSNMQQHTGEHIFSGIVNSKFGYDNVGFHLSDSEVTMDYNGTLDRDDISEVETLVNRAIWENIEVLCEFPDKAILDTIDYRSKKELTGDVRIVTIPGYDVCACCAPHVERTGEIGFLKVVGLQNYKGGVRVNILCGQRALEYLSAEQEIVSKLSQTFTTSEDKVVSSVHKLMDENARLKAELVSARNELISYEVKEIDKELSTVILKKPEGFDTNAMRKMVTDLAQIHSGFCGVFTGSDENGYRYVIASGTEGRNAKELQEVLKASFAARGGGSPQMIQGSIEKADFEAVKKTIEDK